jgi:antitoxin (DNA-binding transcriptional repressor) of toxin-antitoxin stability system
MRSIDILKAGSLLSRLVQSIEQGRAREIVIERDGRPAARLVPIDTEPAGKRIGSCDMTRVRNDRFMASVGQE